MNKANNEEGWWRFSQEKNEIMGQCLAHRKRVNPVQIGVTGMLAKLISVKKHGENRRGNLMKSIK